MSLHGSTASAGSDCRRCNAEECHAQHCTAYDQGIAKIDLIRNLSQQAVEKSPARYGWTCAFVFAAVLSALDGALWLGVAPGHSGRAVMQNSKFWPSEIHKQAHN